MAAATVFTAPVTYTVPCGAMLKLLVFNELAAGVIKFWGPQEIGDARSLIAYYFGDPKRLGTPGPQLHIILGTPL